MELGSETERHKAGLGLNLEASKTCASEANRVTERDGCLAWATAKSEENPTVLV